jgi:hypothetical protein
MPDLARRRLRWLSAIFLAAAFAMSVSGLTFLKPRLRDVGFVVYWLGCLVTAGAAIVAAMLDLLVISREARRAQRELIEDTFRDVSLEPPRPSVKTGKSPP